MERLYSRKRQKLWVTADGCQNVSDAHTWSWRDNSAKSHCFCSNPEQSGPHHKVRRREREKKKITGQQITLWQLNELSLQVQATVVWFASNKSWTFIQRVGGRDNSLMRPDTRQIAFFKTLKCIKAPESHSTRNAKNKTKMSHTIFCFVPPLRQVSEKRKEQKSRQKT